MTVRELIAVVREHRGPIFMATVTGLDWDPVSIQVVKADLLHFLNGATSKVGPAPWSASEGELVWTGSDWKRQLFLDRAL